MDSNRSDKAGPLGLRTRPLGRPARFEPPQLSESRQLSFRDETARQMAVAVAAGREEGLRRARTEVDAAIAAHDEARRQLGRATRALADAIDQLSMRDQDDLSEIEDQAVRFGFDLAEQLVGRELTSSDRELEATIARAVALVPERGAVTLRVHPGDAERTRLAIDQRDDLGGRAEVVGDATVDPGGCVAVVGPLRIDAQIGAAISRVRDVLAG